MSTTYLVRTTKLALLAALLAGSPMRLKAADGTVVPKVWDDADISDYRLPLYGLGRPPVLLSAREYYALPEVNLKTYPVYAPDKEPPGIWIG